MKIKNYKCKCGSNEFFFSSKGNQTGIYCNECGKWLKWADKDEQNLTLKRTDDNILDKIKAEIENERTFQRVMEEYDTAKGLRMALEIIDKYKDKEVEE